MNRLTWYAVAGALALLNAACCAGLPARQNGLASSAAVPDRQIQSGPALQGLRGLLEQRLALMPDVAWHKWRNGEKIDDPAREGIIVARFVAQAQALGLPAPWAQRFVQAQIEAAKIIQRESFAAWSRAGAAPAGEPPDLRTQIRPRLDALELPLLQALAAAWPVLTDPARHAQVAAVMGGMHGPAVSGAAAACALAPLMAASTAP